MDTTDWEHLREEVCTQLEMGMSRGETELDTVTRLIWQERQGKLEAIEEAVTAALAVERGLVTQKAKVLQWKPPLRPSDLPKRHFGDRAATVETPATFPSDS